MTDRDDMIGPNLFEAEREAWAECPWCGEPVELAVDPGGGPRQSYVEDCSVCCRPMSISLRFASDGSATVEATADDA